MKKKTGFKRLIPSPLAGNEKNRGLEEWRSSYLHDKDYSSNHLFRYSSKKRAAFTLAEVLITLGIIGIVAAVTLPTLIANYQKQATVNKIKKFYTNMNQVLMQAQVDNGEYSTWSIGSSVGFYNKYIKPYVKNVDKIETDVHIHGYFMHAVRFVFADGTQAIFSTWSNGIDSDKSPIFVYDTSAKKHGTDDDSTYLRKPTRERFFFKINDKGMLEPPHMTASRQSNINSCKFQWVASETQIKSNNGNLDCSTLIYKDGWKIAPDYPW